MNQLALPKNLHDIIAEYNQKTESIAETVAALNNAITNLEKQSRVGGTYGNKSFNIQVPQERQIKSSLTISAWMHVYEKYNFKQVMTANDKKLFEQSINNEPPFTIENIKATFGDYILNPRANILRGLAEVFRSLDPAYKSHEKMKIGVKGLPKRVILSNISSYGYGWAFDKLRDIMKALASYRGHEYPTRDSAMCLINGGEWCGLTLKRFKNGNSHLFFDNQSLLDINRALAEYYGDVIADCPEGRPNKKQQSTAVSKDLQYYPTPKNVVDRVIDGIYHIKDSNVLEPSCGCGRFMDALREAGANVYGIEYDLGRVEQCKDKGHKVLQANFLETVPQPDFDIVVMNPPFYGKHYQKHVEHALKFLKPEGRLYSILPSTARYDHEFMKNGRWYDLPFASFAESGTNIETSVLMLTKE